MSQTLSQKQLAWCRKKYTVQFGAKVFAEMEDEKFERAQHEEEKKKEKPQ